MKKKLILLIGILLLVGCVPHFSNEDIYTVYSVRKSNEFYYTQIKRYNIDLSWYSDFYIYTTHLYSVGDTITSLNW